MKKYIQIAAAVSHVITGALLIATLACARSLKSLEPLVPVFVALGAALILLPPLLVRLPVGEKAGRVVRRVLWMVSAGCMAAACWAAVGLGLIITGGMDSQPPAVATVVVLGEGLWGNTASPNQQVSIDAAGAYLRAHPEAVCITSGGFKGMIPGVTEASVMKQELVSRYGIRASRIIEENRSQTTYQNLKFTAAIIQKYKLSRHIALVTPAYHAFRGQMLARREGLIPYEVPGRLILSQQWSNYLRELIAIPKSFLLDR